MQAVKQHRENAPITAASHHAGRVVLRRGPRRAGRECVQGVFTGLLVLATSVSAQELPGASPPPPGPGVARAVPASGDAAANEERDLRREQMEAAQTLLREHPVGDAAFALAMVFNEQGDVTSALRHWQDGLKMPRETVRLHHRAEVLAEYGEALKIQEQFDQAEQAFRESIELQPRREQTLLRLGQLLYDRGRVEESLSVLDAGQAKSAPAFGLRGKACQRLGRIEEARGHFEAALKRDPNLAEACYGLSVISARLGSDAEAAEYRARFARLKAERQTFGREYRASLNPLRNTRQSLAMTHTTVAWVYRDRGQVELAERLWRRAAELDPANTACRFHLLMLYQQTGRNDQALGVCGEMIQAEPNNPFHRLSLGNLETRRGRTNEAGAAYEAAHRLGPNRPETCFALAQFYLRANTNLLTAASLAARAVELAPVAPHQYVLSRAAARTGDRATALAAIQRACELDPANTDYQAWRRTLTTDQGRP
jgi:tetratricopeptide (TPR) repeat protein